MASTDWDAIAQAVRDTKAHVLVLDSAMRLFMTLVSSYYRFIGIPESLFGVVSAVFAA